MSDENIIAILFLLTLYPLVMLLTPEPISFLWLLKNGRGKPMPQEMARRSERNEGYLMLAKFMVLIACTAALMRHSPVPVPTTLFYSINWRVALLAGLTAGFALTLWVLTMRIIASRLPMGTGRVPFLLREPLWKIFTIVAVGAFAEEFWRALSLYQLRMQNVSVITAILMTSTVFGIGHLLSPQPLPKALGRILQAGIGGLFLGALFLYFHTLMVPFTAHIMVNSFGVFIGRRTLVTTERLASS